MDARLADPLLREDLREQHAVGDEIAEALTSGAQANTADEEDLEEELEALQQEELDNKMLDTGTMPVSDQVHKMPTPARGEIKGKAPQRAQEEDEDEELEKLKAEMAL